MIKIKYVKYSSIDTTLDRDVDYYTEDNTTMKIYFLGVKIFSREMNLITNLIKKGDKNIKVGF